MSKNFELLTQLGEKCGVFHHTVHSVPEVSQPPVVQAAQVSAPGVSWIQEDTASPEETKLVQRLFILAGQEAPRSVVFCGIDEEGDDSSRLCARVGEMLAERTTGRVCVIDANLPAPSLRKRYGMENHLGFSDASVAPGSVENLPQQISGRNLWLLAPDGRGQSPLSAGYFRSVIPGLAQQFSTILMAAPPVNLCPDTLMLAQLVQGVVLVIKANSTRRAAAMRVKEILEASQVRLLGAVLTDRTYPIPESLYRRL